MVVIRLSENFVYDVLALISVHDVVALNTYLLDVCKYLLLMFFTISKRNFAI